MVFCYSSWNGPGHYCVGLVRIKGLNSSVGIRQNHNTYRKISYYDSCVHGGTQGPDSERVRLSARQPISHSREVWSRALRRDNQCGLGIRVPCAGVTIPLGLKSGRGNEAVPFHTPQMCQSQTALAAGVGQVEKRRCACTAVGSK